MSWETSSIALVLYSDTKKGVVHFAYVYIL